MLNCLAVGAGGFIGSIARYLISLIKIPDDRFIFPATFLTNVIGAFAIGFIIGYATEKGGMDPKLMLFLKVGVCGGFTTFSTFSLESSNLFNEGQPVLGVIYAAVSVIACIIAVVLGDAAAS